MKYYFTRIKFTEHAKERLKKRKITEDEVINTIKFPERLTKEHEKYYAQKDIGRGRVEVFYERIENEEGIYLNIITVYWL